MFVFDYIKRGKMVKGMSCRVELEASCCDNYILWISVYIFACVASPGVIQRDSCRRVGSGARGGELLDRVIIITHHLPWLPPPPPTWAWQIPAAGTPRSEIDMTYQNDVSLPDKHAPSSVIGHAPARWSAGQVKREKARARKSRDFFLFF